MCSSQSFLPLSDFLSFFFVFFRGVGGGGEEGYLNINLGYKKDHPPVEKMNGP